LSQLRARLVPVRLRRALCNNDVAAQAVTQQQLSDLEQSIALLFGNKTATYAASSQGFLEDCPAAERQQLTVASAPICGPGSPVPAAAKIT
jgi:hypothetical protein